MYQRSTAQRFVCIGLLCTRVSLSCAPVHSCSFIVSILRVLGVEIEVEKERERGGGEREREGERERMREREGGGESKLYKLNKSENSK